MAFDSREFRDTLGRFATGVTVVTTGDAPNFVGMTAQSFSSLSLDPPLVLVCVDKGASVLPLLKESATFTVNVLADSDMDLSNFFASSSRPAPPQPVRRHAVHRRRDRPAALACATTVFDCHVHEVLDGGDHEIIVVGWRRSTGRMKIHRSSSSVAPIAPSRRPISDRSRRGPISLAARWPKLTTDRC